MGRRVEQPVSDTMSDRHTARRSFVIAGLYSAVLVLGCASLADAQDTLPPVTVTVTRTDVPLARLPFAVAASGNCSFISRDSALSDLVDRSH